jgi:hypothetical protein
MLITRRRFLGIAAAGIGGLALGPAWPQSADPELPGNGFGALYRQFHDPDRKYSIRPFWFWNGKLESSELRRQIEQMVEHGVYGAYAHNRDGLQTPYLSEEWWTVLGEALQAAHDNGFSLCMVDEFEWPSGEARDYWLPGLNKSRVVAANPDFQVRRLHPTETRIQGPRRQAISLPEETIAVGVGKLVAERTLDGASLKALAFDRGSREMSWDVPDGDWIVFTYSLERTSAQPDFGTVDLMNREAIAEYIRIYYEEFYRRHGKHFGAAMPATFADHEGCYGGKLPWTAGFFEAFRKKAGYQLEPWLPGLTYDIGAKTEKVRCDLLDTVSEFYCENFFRQVSDWCDRHNIAHSAHVWEETLLFGPSYQGDFFRILRSMTNPGCDTLEEWGRQSIWLKENASVADFEKRHVVCETQGVQGEDSYLSPERMRRVSNCLGAWNIAEFIPHAFDYDLSRTNYPPDWFRSQPFLPWFRSYADQMRRISFMNRDSHLVADILLYYPQVSVWGQASPSFFDTDRITMMNAAIWSSDAKETDAQYAELKLRLSEARLDYQVADDYYLGQSRIEGNRLRIADSRFQTLILPPMSTIRRETAEQVRKFYNAGGTVIAFRRLPTISTEDGRDDRALVEIWSEIFDSRSSQAPCRLRTNAAGGRAYFVPRSVLDLMGAVRQYIDPDVSVVEGSPEALYALHKIKENIHFYWIINDTPQSRSNVLSLKTLGRPERWEADNAQRSPLFYQTLSDRTLVRITLGPWDAAYVAFDPTGPGQPLALKATNLDDLHVAHTTGEEVTVYGKSLVRGEALSVAMTLGEKTYEGSYQPGSLEPVVIEGNWKVTAAGPEIPLPYAQVADDPGDRGLQAGWSAGNHDGCTWQAMWLSPMSRSFRDWNVIGPFPNPGDRGLEQVYPPESSIDYSATYIGDGDAQLRWSEVHSGDYQIYALNRGWNIGTMAIEGGPYGNDSFFVRYDELFSSGHPHGTVFAQTNLFSHEEIDAVLVLNSPNPKAVFLNRKQVYSHWLRPLYSDMTDGFSVFIPVHLKAGWNGLLLKFLHNPAAWNTGVFLCRAQRSDGSAIEGLFCSTRTYDDAVKTEATGYRWLRFSVSPLAGALKVPPMKYPWLAFVDGAQVTPSSEIPLSPGAKSVVLRVSAAEPLVSPFAFSTVSASLPLGSWKVPGQEHYSGQMTYEKSVAIPASLLSERLLLDCGDVGVVAEAWVNGQQAGSRAWAPYVFDITDQVHAGANQIKVLVANTESNGRAVGRSHSILDEIDLDGFHGPAKLVPYVSREIRLLRKA